MRSANHVVYEVCDTLDPEFVLLYKQTVNLKFDEAPNYDMF